MLLLILLFVSFSYCAKEFPALNHLKPKVSDDVQTEAVENLLLRLVPNHAHKFLIKVDRNLVEDGKDLFEIEKLQNGSVVITGTTGVVAANGFNHYLKYYCMGQVSWQTSNLDIPYELPYVKTRIVLQDKFRYYQNVCTSSYSFVWWNWADWEKHIDWIALNSYNLVLAIDGSEIIWKRVYERLNLTKQEIDEHFVGPAFLAWGRMGNIRGWGGPLPESWHLRSLQLQHRLLDRMRSFGILPVLPAFAGHVPRAFNRIFPESKLSTVRRWNNFIDTYCCPSLVEPTDPLFQSIGDTFMKELIDEYGTDHVYSCDTFNEMPPNEGSESYLQAIGKAVYMGMASYDPKAIWIMQGWIFSSEASFWTENRAKALLTSVPQGKMIILDLSSDQRPQYERLSSYFGQPFIWCMLHNFGGTLGMFGSSITINTKVYETRRMVNGTMIGTGITPEGINQNYVIYDLMSESSWRTEPTNLTEWFSLYALRRYGRSNHNANKAWQILKDTVYKYELSFQMHGLFVLTRRPSISIQPWSWYDKCDLLQAFDYLLQAADLESSSGYRHDIVDVTRQVLQDFIDDYYNKVMISFNNTSVSEFQVTAYTFLSLFYHLENILSTNKAFLIGNWINSAKMCATNSEEEQLYEYNARNQLTLWGPNGEILDYSNKQWEGMVADYYRPRWITFIEAMYKSLILQTPFDQNSVHQRIFEEIEKAFTFSRKKYSGNTSGDTILTAQAIRKAIWALQECNFIEDS